MRFHVLQHVPFEGPAAIAAHAARHEHPVATTRLFAGEPLPAATDFDCLVVMGGPMSVNETDQHPWLAPEIACIADAIAADQRVLGVCLGAQLIASALGARVYPGPAKEIGWFPVRRVSADPPFGPLLPATFTPLHWHGDTFDLPAGATRLAATDLTPNQAFNLGPRVLALQFHLEATPESVADLVAGAGHEITPGTTQQPAPDIETGARQTPVTNALLNQLLDRLLA